MLTLTDPDPTTLTPTLTAASRHELYGVRIAACPSCGGTELTHHGGNKSNYYYRCKKCDPNKSGKTFKAPRPPASYKKKKVA